MIKVICNAFKNISKHLLVVFTSVLVYFRTLENIQMNSLNLYAYYRTFENILPHWRMFFQEFYSFYIFLGYVLCLLELFRTERHVDWCLSFLIIESRRILYNVIEKFLIYFPVSTF